MCVPRMVFKSHLGSRRAGTATKTIADAKLKLFLNFQEEIRTVPN
jgi:hypothetical protein